MRKVLCFSVVLVIACSAEPQEQVSTMHSVSLGGLPPISQFVCRSWSSSSFEMAVQYKASDYTELWSILSDTDQKACWAATIRTAAWIPAPGAVEPIIQFLETVGGDTSSDKALTAAIVAAISSVGVAAHQTTDATERSIAFQYLKSGTLPDWWKRASLKWVTTNPKSENEELFFAEMAISGLVYIGTQDAVNYLEHLANSSSYKVALGFGDPKRYFDGTLDNANYVLKNGLPALFIRGRTGLSGW